MAMKTLIIDNTEAADAYYNIPLMAAVSQVSDCEVVPYRQAILDDSVLRRYGAVVLSGVPLGYSFDTIDERPQRLQWLRTSNVPVLGICLGHQSIGRVFGSEVSAMEGEYDDCAVSTVEDDPIFSRLGSEFTVDAHHHASISLPLAFKQLASSATCTNQVMKHASKDIYGCQFHPEFSEVGQTFLQNFISIARSHQAVSTLEIPDFTIPVTASPDMLLPA